ncbi:MAG: hypothetical protein HQK79_22905 [Desulfobacterales bacterium]|nr:hypothetical protein [Desulfobacterales bacterium]
MSLEAIETELKAKIGDQSVSEIDEIPFNNYEEFLELHKSNQIKIGVQYDGDLVTYFGSKGEVIMHTILVCSPLFISLALVVLAIFTSNYLILCGIPLTLLGFILSSPFFMKGIGSAITFWGFIAFVYFCFKNLTIANLIGSYIFSNFFTTVAREQCRMIVHETILKSELVFIWIYMRGIINIQRI